MMTHWAVGRSVPNSSAMVGKATIEELVSNTVMKIPIAQTRKTRYLCSRWVNGPFSLCVGDEARLLDAVGADRLVFLSGAAARARGSQDLAASVPDQHAADLRQKLALRGSCERDEEVRIVLRAARERAA